MNDNMKYWLCHAYVISHSKITFIPKRSGIWLGHVPRIVFAESEKMMDIADWVCSKTCRKIEDMTGLKRRKKSGKSTRIRHLTLRTTVKSNIPRCDACSYFWQTFGKSAKPCPFSQSLVLVFWTTRYEKTILSLCNTCWKWACFCLAELL